MKSRPAKLLAPLVIALVVAISNLIPQAEEHTIFDGNYPAVVCPGALAGGTEVISLPEKRLSSRVVLGKSETLKISNFLTLKGSTAPTLISGNPGSEIAFESISGTHSADAVCEVGGADQWFIGGTGGVTSQGILHLVNSGLSSSTLQIFPYNSKVALNAFPITIKANSFRNLSLASLVPGEEAVALHIVTTSGRVTSFLLDHRRNGLHDLGSSFVNPVSAPTTVSYIAGIDGSTKGTTSTIRFLVPGAINAHVHLTIYSNGGSFIPIGFDSLQIQHQRVIDLPLPTLSLTRPFGIKVTSDQPIFAGVLTRANLGGSDFSWANQLSPLTNFAINFAGSKVGFFFIGKSLSIQARWKDPKGVARSAVLSGDSAAFWRPDGIVSKISFKTLSKAPIYGGAILTSTTGTLNYLPLLSNVIISRAKPPIADIRVLTRH